MIRTLCTGTNCADGSFINDAVHLFEVIILENALPSYSLITLVLILKINSKFYISKNEFDKFTFESFQVINDASKIRLSKD